jgi:hypothetical protein
MRSVCRAIGLVVRWASTRTFDPCFFQSLPRDGSPCIITSPYLHQVGQRTFTSKLLSNIVRRNTDVTIFEPPYRDPYVRCGRGEL